MKAAAPLAPATSPSNDAHAPRRMFGFGGMGSIILLAVAISLIPTSHHAFSKFGEDSRALLLLTALPVLWGISCASYVYEVAHRPFAPLLPGLVSRIRWTVLVLLLAGALLTSLLASLTVNGGLPPWGVAGIFLALASLPLLEPYRSRLQPLHNLLLLGMIAVWYVPFDPYLAGGLRCLRDHPITTGVSGILVAIVCLTLALRRETLRARAQTPAPGLFGRFNNSANQRLYTEYLEYRKSRTRSPGSPPAPWVPGAAFGTRPFWFAAALHQQGPRRGAGVGFLRSPLLWGSWLASSGLVLLLWSLNGEWGFDHHAGVLGPLVTGALAATFSIPGRAPFSLPISRATLATVIWQLQLREHLALFTGALVGGTSLALVLSAAQPATVHLGMALKEWAWSLLLLMALLPWTHRRRKGIASVWRTLAVGFAIIGLSGLAMASARLLAKEIDSPLGIGLVTVGLLLFCVGAWAWHHRKLRQHYATVHLGSPLARWFSWRF